MIKLLIHVNPAAEKFSMQLIKVSQAGSSMVKFQGDASYKKQQGDFDIEDMKYIFHANFVFTMAVDNK